MVEQLISENKVKEAEIVLDMCMKKMPVNEFGYYTLLEPIINSYYRINKSEKASQIVAIPKASEAIQAGRPITIL